MSVFAQRIIEELQIDNPMYHDFVFDKALVFTNTLANDPQHAPNGNEDNQENMLYCAAQGYISGYAAGIDEDFDFEADTDYDTPEFSLAIADAGIQFSYRIARTAKYSDTISRMIGNGAATYYSTYGFALGLEQGIEDLLSGEAQQFAANAPDQNGQFDFMFSSGMRDFSKYWLPEAMFLAGFEPDKPSKRADDLMNTLMNIIEESTFNYVSSICGGYSGYNSCGVQAMYNRTIVYAEAFTQGFSEECCGIAVPSYDFRDIPLELMDNLGAFANIDDYFRDDVNAADIAKAFTFECVLSNEDIEAPNLFDAYWQINGIGYAEGRLTAIQHSEYIQDDTTENYERRKMLHERFSS